MQNGEIFYFSVINISIPFESIFMNIILVWEFCSEEIGMLTTEKSLQLTAEDSKLGCQRDLVR